jgi:hypothetical protein
VREGGQPDRPAILVLSHAAGAVENEVLAGIEEEGVPSVVERPRGGGDASALARAAADRSSLSVGVGIDDRGRVCVQHDKLDTVAPGLSSAGTAAPETARVLGHNAARLVVGIPLRLHPSG